ncbi:MAG: hypothetical protein CM15mP12_6170 [Gammaproteobacteria bacterium]|nr:MAG: hypothetical protein CM15mP12_6170 [Gammaproteobacteria bacterium]
MPILGTQLVMYGLTTTDYIMAGYYSSDDLAGLGLAASIFNPIYFLTAGVMFGINPIIAQLYGKRFCKNKTKNQKVFMGSAFDWVCFFSCIKELLFDFQFYRY